MRFDIHDIIKGLRPEFWSVSLAPLWIGALLVPGNQLRVTLRAFLYTIISGPFIPPSAYFSMKIAAIKTIISSYNWAGPLALMVAASLIVGPLVPGGAYIVNAYFDREGDKRSVRTKHLSIVQDKLLKRGSLVLATLFFFAALVLSFLIGGVFFYLTVFGIVLGIMYSLPPVRLKSIPILDTVTNGIAYGILPTLAGWVVLGGSINQYIIIIAFPIALCTMAGHTALAIPDSKVDEYFNQNTTAVVLGKEKTGVLSFFLLTAYAALILLYSLVGLLPLLTILALVPIAMAIETYFSIRKHIAEEEFLDQIEDYNRIVIYMYAAVGFFFLALVGG